MADRRYLQKSMERRENRMENLVTLTHVEKSFGKKKILTDLTFDVKPGDSIALIGKNGTGKSTILKMIGDFMKVSKGTIQYKKDIKIGYVPEHFPKLNIAARTYILQMAQIEGMKEKEAEEKSNELFDHFFMSTMVDTPLKYLSKGTLQKVAVIQAFMMKPDLFLFDEPLSGQDSASQKNFIQYVNELNQQGTAILISCHEQWLVQAISKTVYEIKNKTIVRKKLMKENITPYHSIYIEQKDSNDLERIEQLLAGKYVKLESNQGMIMIMSERNQINSLLTLLIERDYVIRRITDENMD